MRISKPSPKGLLKMAIVLLLTLVPLGLTADHLLRSYHDTLVSERKSDARNRVAKAYKLLDYYSTRIEKGDLTDTAARRYALAAIDHISPKNANYYWIIDTETQKLILPERNDIDKARGRKALKAILSLSEAQSEGYVTYEWDKPDGPNASSHPKISYLKTHAPFGWIVGSGVYVDDINDLFWNTVYIAGGASVAILLFLIALGVTVTEILKKPELP